MIRNGNAFSFQINTFWQKKSVCLSKVCLSWRVTLLRGRFLVVPIICSNWMSDNTQSYAAPAPVLPQNQVSLKDIYLTSYSRPNEKLRLPTIFLQALSDDTWTCTRSSLVLTYDWTNPNTNFCSNVLHNAKALQTRFKIVFLRGILVSHMKWI